MVNILPHLLFENLGNVKTILCLGDWDDENEHFTDFIINAEV